MNRDNFSQDNSSNQYPPKTSSSTSHSNGGSRQPSPQSVSSYQSHQVTQVTTSMNGVAQPQYTQTYAQATTHQRTQVQQHHQSQQQPQPQPQPQQRYRNPLFEQFGPLLGPLPDFQWGANNGQTQAQTQAMTVQQHMQPQYNHLPLLQAQEHFSLTRQGYTFDLPQDVYNVQLTANTVNVMSSQTSRSASSVSTSQDVAGPSTSNTETVTNQPQNSMEEKCEGYMREMMRLGQQMHNYCFDYRDKFEHWQTTKKTYKKVREKVVQYCRWLIVHAHDYAENLLNERYNAKAGTSWRISLESFLWNTAFNNLILALMDVRQKSPNWRVEIDKDLNEILDQSIVFYGDLIKDLEERNGTSLDEYLAPGVTAGQIKLPEEEVTMLVSVMQLLKAQAELYTAKAHIAREVDDFGSAAYLKAEASANDEKARRLVKMHSRSLVIDTFAEESPMMKLVRDARAPAPP